MPRGHWLWQENLSERLHEVASRPSADPYLFLGVSVLARRRFHDMRLGALFTKARIGQALNNSDYFGWPISYNPRFNREKWHQVTGISEHEGEIYERLTVRRSPQLAR